MHKFRRGQWIIQIKLIYINKFPKLNKPPHPIVKMIIPRTFLKKKITHDTKRKISFKKVLSVALNTGLGKGLVRS